MATSYDVLRYLTRHDNVWWLRHSVDNVYFFLRFFAAVSLTFLAGILMLLERTYILAATKSPGCVKDAWLLAGRHVF